LPPKRRKTMRHLKHIFVSLLVILIFNLHLPTIVLAGRNQLLAKGITKHRPQIFSTPEEKIPEEKIPRERMPEKVTTAKKSKKWVRIIVGVLVAGGAAVAAGGGGGGGDGGSSGGSSGDVTVTW